MRQAPHLGAPEAGRLAPGTPVLIDVIADGWAHLAQANPFRDLGFVALSLQSVGVFALTVAESASKISENHVSENDVGIYQLLSANCCT